MARFDRLVVTKASKYRSLQCPFSVQTFFATESANDLAQPNTASPSRFWKWTFRLVYQFIDQFFITDITKALSAVKLYPSPYSSFTDTWKTNYEYPCTLIQTCISIHNYVTWGTAYHMISLCVMCIYLLLSDFAHLQTYYFLFYRYPCQVSTHLLLCFNVFKWPCPCIKCNSGK